VEMAQEIGQEPGALIQAVQPAVATRARALHATSLGCER
jgi:hypothetical protein